MARFKVDENLPAAVVRALTDAGHDVMTVSDQGLSGSDDATLARISAEESRTVLTLDRGFADARRQSSSATPGIVVLRPASDGQASCLELVRRLLPILANQEVAGSLWIVSADRIRVRRP